MIFLKTNGGCPLLTWEAEDHGLCEVDMFISFLQNDNSTINITIPVGNQAYRSCVVLTNAVAFYYKTTVYSINEQGHRVQINEDNWEKTIVYYSPIKVTIMKTKVNHKGRLLKLSPE